MPSEKKKKFTRDVSHETKIKLRTINRLLNAEYDKIVGYSTLLPLRQMKPVNRKISECHSNELIRWNDAQILNRDQMMRNIFRLF